MQRLGKVSGLELARCKGVKSARVGNRQSSRHSIGIAHLAHEKFDQDPGAFVKRRAQYGAAEKHQSAQLASRQWQIWTMVALWWGRTGLPRFETPGPMQRNQGAIRRGAEIRIRETLGKLEASVGSRCRSATSDSVGSGPSVPPGAGAIPKTVAERAWRPQPQHLAR